MRNWIENDTVNGNLLGPIGCLSYEDFKVKYPDAIVNFMLYKGIVRSEISRPSLDLSLKNTVILMKYGNACQEVVPKHLYIYILCSGIVLKFGCSGLIL